MASRRPAALALGLSLWLALCAGAALAQPDTAPRRLSITVRSESLTEVGLGSRTAARGSYSSRRAGNTALNLNVQALEGRPASIHVGRRLLVPMQQRVRGPQGVTVLGGLIGRDIGNGFVAIATLDGDTVTVEIRAEAGQEIAVGEQAMQSVFTTLSGPLGEWLLLAQSGEDAAQSGGRGDYAVRATDGAQRFLLKVELLP